MGIRNTTAAAGDTTPAPNRHSRRHPNQRLALLGVPEAAAYLGVDHKTVRRLIAANELQAYRLGKRLIKIKAADLDAILTPLNGGAA